MISSFGGNGYTAAKNLNMPIADGERLYDAYKKLHAGIFTWGNGVLDEALRTGYVESAAGFKLKLPMFDRFQRLQIMMDNHDKSFWTLYREGKEENRLYMESKEEHFLDPTKPIYQIQNQASYNVFLQHKGEISEYFSLKSQYFRLCLNNPIQATAAHQTKKAAVLLFNEIKKRGHLKKVRIAVIVHDEIQLEIKEELVEEYKPILSKCMVDGGNYFLVNNVVKMEADAVEGSSWANSK